MVTMIKYPGGETKLTRTLHLEKPKPPGVIVIVIVINLAKDEMFPTTLLPLPFLSDPYHLSPISLLLLLPVVTSWIIPIRQPSDSKDYLNFFAQNHSHKIFLKIILIKPFYKIILIKAFLKSFPSVNNQTVRTT